MSDESNESNPAYRHLVGAIHQADAVDRDILASQWDKIAKLSEGLRAYAVDVADRVRTRSYLGCPTADLEAMLAKLGAVEKEVATYSRRVDP